MDKILNEEFQIDLSIDQTVLSIDQIDLSVDQTVLSIDPMTLSIDQIALSLVEMALSIDPMVSDAGRVKHATLPTRHTVI